MKIAGFFFFLVLASGSVHAADLPPWVFKLVLGYPSAGFELRPLEPLTREPTIKYRPAQVNEVGLGAKYRWLGGTVYFEVLTPEKIRNVEGRSTYLDMHLNYYDDWFGVEADYVHYNGYLIENSQSLLSAATLGTETYYKMGDVSDGGAGINLFYVKSPSTYNLSAGMDQSEVQSKSGGSTLYMMSGRYHEYSSFGGLIPPELRSSFGTDAGFTRARLKTLAPGIGYGQNWVSGSFFFSLMGALSIGWQQVTWGDDSTQKTRESVTGNIHIRAATGWNARGWFTGLGFYFDRHTQQTETIEIGNLVYGGRIFFGVRLG